MAKEEKLQSIIIAEITEVITAKLMAEHDSPYQRLLRKINRIDNDYFDDIRRDSEVLVPELNMELKDKVIQDFEQATTAVLGDEDQLTSLLEAIHQELREAEVFPSEEFQIYALQEALRKVRINIAAIAEDYPRPQASDTELERLFHDAQERTLAERLMSNNSDDIIAFHHALMESTVWACRLLLEKQLINFLDMLEKRLMASNRFRARP